MKKRFDLIGKAEVSVLIIFGISMTLIMFSNAVARYVFDSSFTWAEEVVRILFVWSMFIAITTGFIRNQHIGFTTLAEKNPHLKFVSTLLYKVVLAVVGGVVAWYGYQYNTMIGDVPLAGTNWPTALFLIPGIGAGVVWAGVGIHGTLSLIIGRFPGNREVRQGKGE
jgi:TRAP-type C4-dicarboxylate transport system permease small subunit